MADYTINVNVDSNEANRRLDEVKKHIDRVDKPIHIGISVPSLNDTINGFKQLGQAIQVSYQVAKNLPVIGLRIQDVEFTALKAKDAVLGIGKGLEVVARYANPVNGLSDSFSAASRSARGLVDSTARLGFTIFGVTQSLNIVGQAYKALFDDTIGREVKLRETILKTSITLASTNRILRDGFEITDPTQKLQALEKPINASIQRLRNKSLEIAGTTSDALIQTFSVVAGQIGNFGGDLKDAENLAAKFASALGTIGLGDPMYMRQEVSSILMGNINSDSILAKTLGITSADIQKAKGEVGGLVKFLNDKLAVFEAGQKKAALGWSGITSNLQELNQELRRSFGAPLLDVLLNKLNKFYALVGTKSFITQAKQTASAAGSLVAGTISSATSAVTGSSTLKGVNTDALTNSLKSIEQLFARISSYINDQIIKLTPAIRSIVDTVVKAVAEAGKALFGIAGALAQVKIERIEVQIKAFALLSQAILPVIKAYGMYLNAIEGIINTPLGRYLNELSALWKVLDKVGVMALVSIAYSFRGVWDSLKTVGNFVKNLGVTIGNFFKGLLDNSAGFIEGVGVLLAKLGTLVVDGLAAAFQMARNAVYTFAVAAQTFLTNLAVQLQQAGGAVAVLVEPLLAIARGFSTIATGAKNAELAITTFAQDAKQKLSGVKDAAAGAADNVRNLGTTLREGVGSGLAFAGKQLGSFALAIGKNILGLFLWQLRVTLIISLITKLTDLWEDFNKKQELEANYKSALAALNGGLETAIRNANTLGQKLDAVAQLRKEEADKTFTATRDYLAKEIKDAEDRLKLVQKLRQQADKERGSTTINGENYRNQDFRYREYSLMEARLNSKLPKLRQQLEQVERDARRLNPEGDSNDPIALAAQKRRDQIEELARFEKEARRSIEDTIYDYRRQIQQKELEVFRSQGDIRIQQIEQANRKLIEGADASSQQSLTALATWITTKRKGELDIEVKKRDAQLAAAELDRSIGMFRKNLEEKIAELRKKVQEWEIKTLDQRIKGEQLIANIRNGLVQYDPVSGGMRGDTGLRQGSSGNATGPHFHVGGATTEAEARAIFANSPSLTMTSGYGARSAPAGSMGPGSSFHRGIDLAGPAGTPLTLATGYTLIDFKRNQGKLGHAAFVRRDSDGKIFQIGHMQDPGPSFKVTAGTSPSSASSNLNISGNSPQGNARVEQAMNFFMGRGLSRIASAALVGNFLTEAPDLNPNAKNPKSGAEGLAGWLDTRRTAMYAAGGKGNFNKQLEYAWSELMGGENNAYVGLKNAKTVNEALMAAAKFERFAGYKGAPGSGGEWSTRVANTKAILASEIGKTGTQAGSVGGRDNVTLNIDTGALDGYIARLKQVNQELIALSAQSEQLKNKENFDAFINTLDNTPLLKETEKQLEKAARDKETIMKLTAQGAILDEKSLEITLQHGDAVAALDTKYSELRKKARDVGGITPAEIKEVMALLDKRYKLELENLDKVTKARINLANIEKEKGLLTQLSLDTVNFRQDVQRQLIQGKYAMQSMMATNPTDRRRIEAEQQIEMYRFNITKGGTEVLSPAAEEGLRNFADAARAAADSLAAMDEKMKGMQVRSLISRWSEELRNVQGIIVSLGETIQSEFGNAMSGAITGVINGTQTVAQAFGQMFQNIGKAFIDMATQMIAKALIMKVLGILAGGSGGFAGVTGSAGAFGNISGAAAGFPSLTEGAANAGWIGLPMRAAGGPVTANQPYIVGENGPELFSPSSNGTIFSNSRLRESMAGAPSSSSSSSPILQMSFQTTTINGVEYVSRDQLESAMEETRRLATRDGANRGMAQTLDRLRNSSSTRRRTGIR